MGMFREESGKASSKRITGFSLMVVCIFIFVWKELNGVEITNKDIFNNIMILAVILLGLDILKYINALIQLKNNKDGN